MASSIRKPLRAIIGEVKDANGPIRGFLRTHGRYTLIDAPGALGNGVA